MNVDEKKEGLVKLRVFKNSQISKKLHWNMLT